MGTIRTLVVRCKLPFDQDFRNTVHKFAENHQADFGEVIAFRCNRCRQFIDISPDQASRTTCSNCYGDDLKIIRVRLAFQDWGDQNGGAQARDERMEFARKMAVDQPATERTGHAIPR